MRIQQLLILKIKCFRINFQEKFTHECLSKCVRERERELLGRSKSRKTPIAVDADAPTECILDINLSTNCKRTVKIESLQLAVEIMQKILSLI